MAEILIRKQEIEPGKTDALREWIDDLLDAADDDAAGVKDIWAAETLQTISLFIEHGAEADYLVWYLEADSMTDLIEARQASEHPLHDVEDAMLADVLVDPTEMETFEPLLHGIGPDRPGTFTLTRVDG